MKRIVYIVLSLSLCLNLGLGGFVLWQQFYSAGQTAVTNEDPGKRAAEIEKMEATIEALEHQRAELLQRLQEAEETTPAPDPPAADPVNEGTAADTTVHSWYFLRNAEHLPPGTDAAYKSMLSGRGFYLGPTDSKTVYLTFDAGYENGFTDDILDALADNGVRAAFFVTGSYVRRNAELVKRMDREGHIIGNHSMTHPTIPLLTNEKIEEEIMSVHRMVQETTGQEPAFFRPPAGQFNDRTLRVTSELGYATVFWSMAYRDWEVDNQPGPEVAYRHVMDNLHNGAVILLHNVSSSNAAALDRILKDVKARGYRFGTLDEIRQY